MTKIKDIKLELDITFTVYTDGVMFYIADEDSNCIAEEDTLEDALNLLNNL